MPDDPSCRSEACAGRCNRSEHAMQFSTPSWVYGSCRIHRGCKRFVDIEPLLGPLTDAAEIGRRMDLADEVLDRPAASELPGPVAVAPETSWYVDNRCPHTKAEDGLCWVPDCPEGPDSRRPAAEQPQLVEEVVPDGKRLTEEVSDGRLIEVPERVEGPAPAAGGIVAPSSPGTLLFGEPGSCSLTIPSKGLNQALAQTLLGAMRHGSLTLKRAGFLGAWDSWWCSPCGARAFEQRECCGLPMVAVRMEMHAREVPDG